MKKINRRKPPPHPMRSGRGGGSIRALLKAEPSPGSLVRKTIAVPAASPIFGCRDRIESMGHHRRRGYRSSREHGADENTRHCGAGDHRRRRHRVTCMGRVGGGVTMPRPNSHVRDLCDDNSGDISAAISMPALHGASVRRPGAWLPLHGRDDAAAMVVTPLRGRRYCTRYFFIETLRAMGGRGPVSR